LDLRETADPADVERDPVVAAYLAFLERDMGERPEQIQPITEADIGRIRALTRNLVVFDDDMIPDDITL
jgi:antitoxin PrlF